MSNGWAKLGQETLALCRALRDKGLNLKLMTQRAQCALGTKPHSAPQCAPGGGHCSPHPPSASTIAFKLARARYGDSAGEMTVCKAIEDAAGASLGVEGNSVSPWEVKHPDEP